MAILLLRVACSQGRARLGRACSEYHSVMWTMAGEVLATCYCLVTVSDATTSRLFSASHLGLTCYYLPFHNMSYSLAPSSTYSTDTRSCSGAGDSRRKDHHTVAALPETLEVRYVDIPNPAYVAASNGGSSHPGKRESREKIPRTITTALLAPSTELPPVPKVDDGQIVSFVRQQMKRFEMTWDEIVEMMVALHGSLERAVWMQEVNEAEAKEGLKNAPADGVEFGSIGVSHFCDLEFNGTFS